MQLVLDLKLKSDATFDNFISDQNTILVNVLKNFSEGKGESYGFIWSHPGDGLSHLLQAVCHRAKQFSLESMYLPFAELKLFGPDFLEGIESIPLVCMDDIHLLAREAAWEEALFHTFNRIRERGHQLLLGAHSSVAECGFQLKDLVSRLNWGFSYPILALSDEAKLLLLQQNAQQRGFNLPIDIARYLLTHYSRDMKSQFSILEKLDLASLQEKHKITLPFVKLQLNK